ncbi:MAG: DUF3109 family protein [Fulvivirga sp.]
MIELDKVILSDDIKEKFFVCDLNKCKGACCVEGDLGAPLEENELLIMDAIYKEVEPYLSEGGKAAIKKQGKYILDEDGDYSTPTIGGKECAYAIYDDKGILKCGIEEAYNDGKIKYKKPISCHLYPIRSKKYDEFEALNYDQWHICSPACSLGAELSVPVYKFLKDALTRKYGKEWYAKLCEVIEGEEKES